MLNYINIIPTQIYVIIFLTFAGFTIRSSLVFVGQKWASGYHHLVTYTLLPNIAFIITTTIANNIALSLGMIGALSIVRFRNPVKSPLELTIFFALITLGISASASFNYCILLFGIIIIVILSIEIFQNLFGNYNKKLYSLSFSDGEVLNLLEIETSSNLDSAENSYNLVNSYYNSNDKIWSYKLAFKNKNDLKKFKQNINNDEKILSVSVSYN